MQNLKYKGETMSLVISATIAFLVALYILDVSVSLIIFLLVAQLFYVIFLQKQVQGNSVKITPNQYLRIDKVIDELSIKLNIRRPDAFISFDPYINAYVMGFKNPYTLILTSALVESLNDNELKFVIGHELGHIKFNHSRLKSLITPLDKNIPVITLLFNFWLRKTEYTADRVGLFLTKDINVSTDAILKIAVGSKLAKEINIDEYIDQIKYAYDEKSEKLGELLLTHPYLTNRVRGMVEFYNINLNKE